MIQDLQQILLSEQDIVVHSYENVVVENIPSFLGRIDSIIGESSSIIQLLDSDYICGQKHLNQAIFQAIKAFDEEQNFANDRGLEICVRLSAQKQISQALKLLGIKKKGNVTVIYINSTSNQIHAVEDLLGKRNDAILEEYDKQKICEAYNILSTDNIVEQINEKIALLALKN